MSLCFFIGDEVTAAGFRLAGVTVHVPPPEQVKSLFNRLLTEAELILITAEYADRVPARTLQAAQLRSRPPVLVMPDIRRRSEPPDRSAALRRQLGMAE
jgi:vacuolar-type H+-ATPase subunit F/Vma7